MSNPTQTVSNEVEGALVRLETNLRGDLHRPGEPGYEAARSIWNAMPQRRPLAVVAASGEADVADTVCAARELGLPLSIRGGGHNIAGLAVCDDGLMLDLSRLRGVRVDPETRRVGVGPGACWGDVDREAQRHGLAVPSGIISATGVAGLTLGGGFGWTSRSLGLSCDSLRSADVVTADAETVRATAEREPDLFWGLRGAGSNFGVVSAFEFEAHPVGPTVFAGMRWFPFERAAEVVAAYGELTADAPRELGSLLVLRKAPPAPFLPEAFHGRLAAGIAVCFIGAEDEAEGAIRPLRRLVDPVADTLGPKPFRAFQQVLDAGQPFGRRYYWKSHYLQHWDDALAQRLIEHAGRIESPHSAMLCMHLGGAIADVSEADSAVGNRDARYVVNIQGAWEDPAGDDGHIAWARAYWEALAPWGSGQYVNFLTEDADRAAVESAFGRERLQRLAEVKRRWDPDNLFRMNHNIPPA